MLTACMLTTQEPHVLTLELTWQSSQCAKGLSYSPFLKWPGTPSSRHMPKTSILGPEAFPLCGVSMETLRKEEAMGVPEINVQAFGGSSVVFPLCPGTAWSLCGHHSGSSGERNFQSLFKCFMD